MPTPTGSSSIAGVQTALPAFVGYTERSDVAGQPAAFRPTLINSLAEFQQHFGGPPMTTFVAVEIAAAAGSGPEASWTLVPSGPVGLLYYSLVLFYANGGGACYIVSVGPYKDAVSEGDLTAGVEALAEQHGPTMLVVPDLSCLPDAIALDHSPGVGGFRDVARAMLAQCRRRQDRVALLDVVHARGVDGTSPDELSKAITQFREDVGAESLSYGIAYFPYLDAVVVQPADVDVKRIATEAIVSIPPTKDLQAAAAKVLNRLPPSAAMAGVITTTDTNLGVWKAPANIALNAVANLSVLLNDEMQQGFTHPLDGKAVNPIRAFVGRGQVVWGARTLDGNSQDYRYVSVRRTVIFLEQSIKAGLGAFAQAPNDATTWASVAAMVQDFLHSIWVNGGVLGTKAEHAYSVRCGLGSTMTAQDVLEGNLVVQVLAALVGPAQFIELTFRLKVTPG